MAEPGRRDTTHPLQAGLGLLILCALCPVVAFSAIYSLPSSGTDVVGEVKYVEARQADTLLDIARRFDVGYEEIRLANPGVDPWLPGEGTRVQIPTLFVLPDAPRKGIVINLAEKRLYYYPPLHDSSDQERQVFTHPISIGREGWETPLGTTRIVRKDTDPVWIPPKSIRKEHAEKGDPLPDRILPGPDNPLGKYALRLGFSGYLIHGTNKPFGIGMEVSHGCIRMAPEDIELLFDMISVGTVVRIVNQPFKAGWRDDMLYLEVHPKFVRIGDHKPVKWLDLSQMVETLVKVSGPERDNVEVDWDKANQIAKAATGIPTVTGSRPHEQDRSETAARHIPPEDRKYELLPEWAPH